MGACSPSILPRPTGRLRAAVPAVLYAMALAAMTDPPRHSGNVWSRYMTIESIVERGTLVVEDSPLLPMVTSTADNCLGTECPFWEDCFVVQARQRAQAFLVPLGCVNPY